MGMKSVEGGAHGDPAAAEHAGTTELKRPVEYTALLAVLIRPGSKAEAKRLGNCLGRLRLYQRQQPTHERRPSKPISQGMIRYI